MNNSHIVSGVFNSQNDANNAISELRSLGVQDDSISVVGHKDHHTASSGNSDDNRVTDADNKGSGFAKGATTGGIVGGIAGLAALAIPGIGPFIAGGALIEALGVAGSAAVTSAAVGATAGGLAGAMMKYGVDEHDAKYYEERVNKGDVFVAVDTNHTPNLTRDQISDVFQRYNATTASQQMAS